MNNAIILITGASGCVGQYTSSWLLRNTNAKLLLWLRDPKKLTSIDQSNPRIKLLIGDLRNPTLFAKEIFSATHVIHTATAWGDIKRTNEVNIIAVKKLLSSLNPEILEKFVYFSTASILNKNLKPLPEAVKYGTEYIQTKAKCLQELEEHKLSSKIIAVFPTLVFGGKFDSTGIFPSSYLTQGLKEAFNWLWLARWFKGFSKFHFIHAEDIASVCGHLLNENLLISKNNSQKIPKFVLGQPLISIDQAIKTLLKWKGMHQTPRIPLWGWLIEGLVTFLPIKINAWDRFSIKQRHFIHVPVTNPEAFGNISYAKTFNEILYKSEAPRGKKPIKQVR
ncbi:NAD-dependent epimerase/dehydratase family protein [Prochlorococcus marinus]|uniref:NAD-dependent epimerase/dehydratase family protein n=1 Tax=Prochlorococcus marinus TaxID=1219 RepID=UPI0022B3B79E|nr:NAD(P)-dependent oxidoreductase [Prochlorococcus marinus]